MHLGLNALNMEAELFGCRHNASGGEGAPVNWVEVGGTAIQLPHSTGESPMKEIHVNSYLVSYPSR